MTRATRSGEVVVPLPSAARAPAFRNAFTELADMRVREVAEHAPFMTDSTKARARTLVSIAYKARA